MLAMHSELQELQAKAEKPAAPPASGGGSYADSLTKQLAQTREYHRTLAPEGDIALDLDTEAPLPQRLAAFRYAMLIAERDALGEQTDDVPNWDKLNARYQQLMAYYAAEPDEEPETDSAELESLTQELQSYKQRVVNLERFKKLYFELESRWESSKEKAQKHYDELSEMGALMDDQTRFDEALDNYHTSYESVGELMESEGQVLVQDSASARAAQQATGEIRHLRNIAADQHRIIHDLQCKLADANDQSQTDDVVELLKAELEKQARYTQESDTCIQLLEDELAGAHREVEQARDKLQQLGLTKAELKDVREREHEHEKAIFSLKGEVQRLKNKLRAVAKATPAAQVDPAAKKELALLQQRYAELEERYLDLKTQQ